MSELLSCPWCGESKAVEEEFWDEDRNYFAVRCDGCDAETPHFNSMAGAVDFWNTRADTAPRWIPIGERLPEELTDVLVTFVRKDDLHTGYAIAYISDGYWRFQVEHWTGDYAVTSWQPLPALPPKPASEAKS